MGDVRALFGSLFVALALAACASTAGSDPGGAATDEPDGEAPRVPDPPPRYKHVVVGDASLADPDAETELLIRCGRDKPYVCPLEDGTFACSSIPCLPDCTRIGCVGGDVCRACDGGFRCVSPGDDDC